MEEVGGGNVNTLPGEDLRTGRSVEAASDEPLVTTGREWLGGDPGPPHS